MSALWQLLRCSHLGPTVMVTTFASMMALGAGRGAGTAWVTLAVGSGQLSIGWSNDWLDRGRDRRAGRGDKPLVAGTVADSTVAAAALAALAVCVWASLVSGVTAGAAHLAAVAAAWSYNLVFKRSAASPLPFAIAFGLLPAFVTLGPPLRRLPPAWAVLAAALLGAGAHFTNVLPDLESDARTGVRGLPHRLGRRGATFTAAALLTGAGVAVAAGAVGADGAGMPLTALLLLLGAVCVAGVVTAGLRDRGRVALRFTIATAGAFVGAFLTTGVGG